MTIFTFNKVLEIAERKEKVEKKKKIDYISNNIKMLKRTPPDCDVHYGLYLYEYEYLLQIHKKELDKIKNEIADLKDEAPQPIF